MTCTGCGLSDPSTGILFYNNRDFLLSLHFREFWLWVSRISDFFVNLDQEPRIFLNFFDNSDQGPPYYSLSWLFDQWPPVFLNFDKLDQGQPVFQTSNFSNFLDSIGLLDQGPPAFLLLFWQMASRIYTFLTNWIRATHISNFLDFWKQGPRTVFLKRSRQLDQGSPIFQTFSRFWIHRLPYLN